MLLIFSETCTHAGINSELIKTSAQRGLKALENTFSSMAGSSLKVRGAALWLEGHQFAFTDWLGKYGDRNE